MDPQSAFDLVKVIINGLMNVINKIENDDGEDEKLKLVTKEAWTVLDMVVDVQLQGNDCSASGNQAKTLIKWCYDAEDLLDKENLKIAKQCKYVDRVCQYLPNNKKGKTLQNLKGIVTEWNNILSRETHQTTTTQESNGTRGPHSLRPFIGREADIKKIAEELLPDERKSGITILGMPGLGKTSLARTILRKIVNRFHHISWVDVENGVFVWKKTKEKIDKDLQAHESSASNKHCKHLLIVFDNLLSLKHNEWHEFMLYKKALENNKVRIIITTHNQIIPEITVTAEYILQPLSNECCEQVIKENALLYEADLSQPLRDEIVKSVSKRCGGLPLVAESFGIVLGKCNDEKRKKIENKMKLWDLPEFKSEILPKLLPSYRHMKSELRRCLAYFLLFPSDQHYSSDDLVDLFHLFVGECFYKSDEAKLSWKEIKEECFHDLKERSILQLVPSTQPLYKLQSFGQFFAEKAAFETCLHYQGNSSLSSSSISDTRHLSISWKEFNFESWSHLEKLRKLRTFLSLCAEDCKGKLGEEVPNRLYRSVSYVRVLSLKRTNVKELPKFIHKLKHLRYLDISSTYITELPKTFDKLFALQIFKFKNTKLSHLPKGFHKLINLRYVDWEENDIRNKLRVRYFRNLSGLQSLPLFDIGEIEGYHISELKDLNNLQGSLSIENLQLVGDREKARDAMLHDKCDLKRIVLQWETQRVRNCALDEGILTDLRAPHYLTQLKIINYGGEDLPKWISDSIIEKVHLMECRSCYLPALAKMRNLKTLVLEDMKNITQVSCRFDDDAVADIVVRFPSLESIEIHNMTRLEDWTILRKEDMPCLRQLKFYNCPKIDPSLHFVSVLTKWRASLSIETDA